MPEPGIEITQRRQPIEPAVGHPLQHLLAMCSLLLPQLLDRAGGGGQRVGTGLVQQQIQLTAHRLNFAALFAALFAAIA